MESLFIAFILIVAILGLFGAWPRISLAALSFSLPLIGWSFNIGSLELPVADLVALIALIAFFSRQFLAFVFGWANPRLLWPLLVPFTLFLGITALAAILSPDPLQALWYVIRWLVFMYLAYIFLPYNLVRDARDLKLAIYAILGSLAMMLVSGYLSLLVQDWQSSFYRLKSITWFGIYPFGENHNLIAEFLNVGAFLILTMRALVKGDRVRRLFDIFFIITALAIILTFSRAGWITLALQVVVYAWAIFWTKKNRLSALIAIAIVTVIFLIPLSWRMIALQADNVSSTENRLLLTEISWQAFLDQPLLGHGSGSYMDLVANNLRFIAKYGAPIDAHGMLQKIIAENGILGLAAWFFILLVLGKLAWQAFHIYPRSRNWLLPLFLAGAGGLFFQLFNTSYFKGKVWLPIALGLAAIRLLEEKKIKSIKV